LLAKIALNCSLGTFERDQICGQNSFRQGVIKLSNFRVRGAQADLQHLREFLRGQHLHRIAKAGMGGRSWLGCEAMTAISCSIRPPVESRSVSLQAISPALGHPMQSATEEKLEKNTTEQYAALGRFVEAFEAMVNEVREICINRICEGIGSGQRERCLR
jgi:hypothetical protein